MVKQAWSSYQVLETGSPSGRVADVTTLLG